MHPEVFILALGMFCSVPVIITGMVLWSRNASQKRTMSNNLANEELLRRLERIEQAVDSTAIEVERISESNRFVVKLLAEKSSAP